MNTFTTLHNTINTSNTLTGTREVLLTGLLSPRCAIFRPYAVRRARHQQFRILSEILWLGGRFWTSTTDSCTILRVDRKWTHKCFYEVCELFCFFSLLSGDGRGTSSKSATTTTVTARNCVHIWSLCGSVVCGASRVLSCGIWAQIFFWWPSGPQRRPNGCSVFGDLWNRGLTVARVPAVFGWSVRVIYVLGTHKSLMIYLFICFSCR